MRCGERLQVGPGWRAETRNAAGPAGPAGHRASGRGGWWRRSGCGPGVAVLLLLRLMLPIRSRLLYIIPKSMLSSSPLSSSSSASASGSASSGSETNCRRVFRPSKKRRPPPGWPEEPDIGIEPAAIAEGEGVDGAFAQLTEQIVGAHRRLRDGGLDVVRQVLIDAGAAVERHRCGEA